MAVRLDRHRSKNLSGVVTIPKEHLERDDVFHELRDRKTGECFEREQVRLLVAHGPYDRDLDGRSQA